MSTSTKKIIAAQELAKNIVRDYLKNRDNKEPVLKLWKYLAMSRLIDYRQPKFIARQIQVEVFESGVLPFTDLDYQICRDISKEINTI